MALKEQPLGGEVKGLGERPTHCGRLSPGGKKVIIDDNTSKGGSSLESISASPWEVGGGEKG